jgi:hypothetical protein
MNLNEAVLTKTTEGESIAVLTMPISRPNLKLFDQVLISHGRERGKSAIVAGVSLIVEPTCCYWAYFLRGEGVDSSCSHAGHDLQPIELGKLRRPRIKQPEFQLFAQVTLETGEHGFISGVEMTHPDDAEDWQYSVFGVGISQGDFFCFEEFQQPKSVQAA